MSRRRPSVCALVPHFDCEPWLGQAIESLLGQTRPPDAVVVVDDASPRLPVEVARRHPGVTFLAAADNGGPYRLVQAVIERSNYDFYLFQDADDWSAPDRLEALLERVDATGAELVGSHELRVLVEEGDVVAVRYPLDVNAALAEQPVGFPLLHPTSIVARDLVMRIGGFASGMRFSGDAEFLRRAAQVATVVNADHFGYFRRKRAGSLTTAPGTGHQSPDRLAVQAALAARARGFAEARRRGRRPDLRPFRTAPLPALQHLAGPPLGRRAPGRRPASSPPPSSGAGKDAVLVVGAPRAGQGFLAWALDQHPAFTAVPDARWLAATVAAVERLAGDDASPSPPGYRAALTGVVHQLAAAGRGRRWVAHGAAVTAAVNPLVAAFPSARLIHVVRPVDEVVADLAARPTDGGAYHSPDGAWRAWLAGAGAGLAAEQRLGADRVLRVRHCDLASEPAAVLEACLRFLGERVDPAVERALAALEPSPPVEPPPGPADVVRASRHLSALLLAEPGAEPVGAARAGDQPEPPVEVQPGAGVARPLVERLRRLVLDSVPAGSTVLVASKGDERMLALDGRDAWHFPQVEGGTYAGHHPADSADALAHLDDLRRAGADHLVLPAAAFWWLDHYEGVRRHLDERAAVVAFHEEVGIVYRLEGGNVGVRPLAAPPQLVVSS